jgi:hypothetical protein
MRDKFNFDDSELKWRFKIYEIIQKIHLNFSKNFCDETLIL